MGKWVCAVEASPGEWERALDPGQGTGKAVGRQAYSWALPFPLCLQTPVGPESPPARMVGVRVCSGCVTHGETAQREVTTSAAAPCFHFQVRRLSQGLADPSFITLRKGARYLDSLQSPDGGNGT